jgi:hypothetical protein
MPKILLTLSLLLSLGVAQAAESRAPSDLTSSTAASVTVSGNDKRINVWGWDKNETCKGKKKEVQWTGTEFKCITNNHIVNIK